MGTPGLPQYTLVTGGRVCFAGRAATDVGLAHTLVDERAPPPETKTCAAERRPDDAVAVALVRQPRANSLEKTAIKSTRNAVLFEA